MPKLILASGVVIMLVMAGVALWLDPPIENADFRNRRDENVGMSAGAIYSTRLTDVDGKEQTLGQWQSRLLVINFWATWCTPCREEMPMLAKLQRDHEKVGLQILGIAVDSRENVAKYVQLSPTNYPLFPDEARAIELSKRLGNKLGLLPFTVVIRPGGEVIFSRMGMVKEPEMLSLIVNNSQK